MLVPCTFLLLERGIIFIGFLMAPVIFLVTASGPCGLAVIAYLHILNNFNFATLGGWPYL